MNLLRGTAVILIFALILPASNFLISSPATSSTSNNLPSVTQTNVAYLNGTETYYTNAGQTSTGSITYYSQPNYYLNSTAIFAGSVGTTQSVNSVDNIYLGTYQYVGYSGVGNGLISSSYAETPDMAIAFEAGVAAIASGIVVSYDYNVGTIYATLTMVNVSSGSQIQSSWQYQMDTEWSYPGSSGVIFSPEWFPGAPGGTYYFYLYVGVTPFQNYNAQLPSNAETTSNAGYLIDNFAVSYPSAPSYVYFEDGWTYSGLTYSGLSVYDYSSSFTPSFPQDIAAIEISFSSPFSVEMYVLTSYGTVNTFQENSGSLAFSTYLPEGGYFGNIYGEPNVPQFSINWYAENAVIPRLQSISLVSTGALYESGNWFNSTGGNSYQFQFSPASGALNGQTVDGMSWSTTLSYSVGHLLDYGHGAAVNLFSVNGKNITSPGLYNLVAGSLTDSNLATSVPIDISTANLVNYVPSLTSNFISTQTAPITEGVNFTLNVSDTIQYEPYFISVDWGDGTYTVSSLSTNSSITVNHAFYSPGTYTPTVTITNKPNAPEGSLTSKIYNLESVSISSIPVEAVTNTSEVNPFQSVGFSVIVPQETLPLSDGLVLSFGDGSVYSPPSFANFSVSHSYNSTGTFDAILEISARGNLAVENVDLKPISVVPILASAKSYENGMFEHLTLNYSSMSPLREVALYLNGTIAKVFPGPENSGNLYYNFTLDHDQRNFASWNLTTLYGYSMNFSQYYTQEFIPVISSLTSSSNPSATGRTVSFSYDINWGNDTGSTEIEINGRIISGNTYIFPTPGTYNVTLVASNSQGSAEYSINEKIGSKPSINYLTSNSSSTFVRSSIEFKTNISWNGDDGNITWRVNGNPVMKNEVYLIYRFNYSGSFNVSVLASNIFGTSTEHTYEFVHKGIPQMLRAYSSQNPLYAGNSGAFYADVNWTGNTGIVTWAVNGHNISGNTYLFLSSGNYTVTATATNSYGTNSTSFTEKVLSTVSKYAITFNETGLPLGTSWSVTFNGTTEISASDTITFTVSNGTYSYTVYPVSGYSVLPSSGSISVIGSNVSKAVTYTSMSIPPAKTLKSGLSNTDIYGIIGSVVTFGAIGFSAVLMRRRK